MNIENIEIGKTYDCKFTVNIPLDEWGRPGGMHSLADVPVVRVGDYSGTGLLLARDTARKLVEVRDHKSNTKFVVKFKDIVKVIQND
tara:strand:+ start:108 stop:368 length:261 start_codon:yes stop_codon:yes gene_type:complete